MPDSDEELPSVSEAGGHTNVTGTTNRGTKGRAKRPGAGSKAQESSVTSVIVTGPSGACAMEWTCMPDEVMLSCFYFKNPPAPNKLKYRLSYERFN